MLKKMELRKLVMLGVLIVMLILQIVSLMKMA